MSRTFHAICTLHRAPYGFVTYNRSLCLCIPKRGKRNDCTANDTFFFFEGENCHHTWSEKEIEKSIILQLKRDTYGVYSACMMKVCYTAKDKRYVLCVCYVR
jgi:hypothetical protein